MSNSERNNMERALKIGMDRELARIKATQYRQAISRYGRPVKPLNFEDWFDWTVEKIRSRGAKVDIICEIVFITWPGQPVTGFSKLDFEKEYKTVYLKGKRATA